MARVGTFGWELGSATAGVEFATVSGGTVSQDHTHDQSAYAGHISALVSGTGKSFGTNPGVTYTTYFARVYIYIVTLPGATNGIMVVTQSNATVLARVQLNTTGTLLLADEDGTIGTSVTALRTNTWEMIEVKVDTAPAPGAHVVELKINGVVAVTSSTRNLSAVPSRVQVGGNISVQANVAGDWYFDDLAINDATGANQTSYPGPGCIVHLRPNGQDDSIGPHTAPFALTGDTSEYLCIDDPPPPDDATTFVAQSTGTGAQYYPMTDLPAELPSGTTINVVHAGWRAASSAASQSNDMILRLRQSGTDTSVTDTSSVTAYRTNKFAAATTTEYPITRYVNAGTGVAFTVDDLNNGNVLLGLERSTAHSSNGRITAVWACVEYVPSTSALGPPVPPPTVRRSMMRRAA